VRLDTRQIPEEGLTLIEDFNPGQLDLESDLIKFSGPIKARAVVNKSYNAVNVNLSLDSIISINCGRCLKEEKRVFNLEIRLDYAIDKLDPIIELDEDIRGEIILDYPIKPLCKVDCKGLCAKCGANLNEGGCNCGTT